MFGAPCGKRRPLRGGKSEDAAQVKFMDKRMIEESTSDLLPSGEGGPLAVDEGKYPSSESKI